MLRNKESLLLYNFFKLSVGAIFLIGLNTESRLPLYLCGSIHDGIVQPRWDSATKGTGNCQTDNDCF